MAVIAAAIAIPVITNQRHQNSNGSQHREPAYGPQVTLPFTGLKETMSVAVDSIGNVYVTDFDQRVVELDTASSTQTVLPFTGLRGSVGVAVDGAGSVYLADCNNPQVLKLAAGSSTPTVLPFTGLNNPRGVAVDTAGDVYITDSKPRQAPTATGC